MPVSSGRTGEPRSSLAGLAAHSGLPALLAAAAVLHVLIAASVFTRIPQKLYPEAALGMGRASDFFGIYQAGANLIEGRDIYEPDTAASSGHRVVPYYYFYRYLPPLTYISAPVTLLFSPWTAYHILFALNEALIALAVWLVLSWKRFSAARRAAASALWLAFTPIGIEQYMGQFSIIMAVLILILLRFDELGPRSLLLTSSWSGTLLLKAFPALLLFPYIRDRLYRRIVWGIAAAAALSIPYFALNPGGIIEFLRLNLSPFTVLYKGDFGFQAFLRVVCGAFGPGTGTHQLELFGAGLDGCRIVLALSTAAVLIAALAATYRLRGIEQRRAWDIMLWTCVFFLIYKTIWEYHYVMLLPALTAALLLTGSRFAGAMGVLVALPTLFPLMPLLGIDPSLPVGSWPSLFRWLYFAVKAVPVMLLFIWTLSRIGSLARPAGGAHSS